MYFLTEILHQEYEGHVLGIADADSKTNDEDEFYNSIFSGKNPQNDVAVVYTNKLYTDRIDSQFELGISFRNSTVWLWCY